MVSNRGSGLNRFVRAETIEQVRDALAADPGLRPIGGATAVVSWHRDGAAPGRWLTTDSVAGLRVLEVGADGTLMIGAAATLRQIETDPRVRAGWPLLAEAIGHIAGPAVRGAATLGGSLALGAASPDPAAALCALGASVELLDGPRLPVAELPLLSGPGAGFIVRARVPSAAHGRGAYERFTVRGASDQPFVIVAARITAGTPRVVAWAGQDRPTSLHAVAQAITRGEPWLTALESAIADLALPDSDRGSTAFRRRILRVLARRAIEAVLATHEAQA